jgi:histidine ammonia-lyase
MGANAATKCLQIVNNLERILAIELMNASQALSFRRPLKSSRSIENFVNTYRKEVPLVEHDRILAKDIKKTILFFDSLGVDNKILF